MKPHRIRMTHNLLLNYGLYRKMEIYVTTDDFSFVSSSIKFSNQSPNEQCIIYETFVASTQGNRG